MLIGITLLIFTIGFVIVALSCIFEDIEIQSKLITIGVSIIIIELIILLLICSLYLIFN